MKALALLGVAGLALGVAGCTDPFQGGVAVAAKDVANIIAHSPQACTDLAQLGGSAQTVAAQVAAANPNSPQIRTAASNVQSSAGAANSDCQKLAAAFTAEAPKSQLTRKIKLDPKVWASIKKD